MANLVGDVLVLARNYLNDPSQTRWSDDDLIRKYNAAVSATRRDFPIQFTSSSFTVSSPTPATATGDTFSMTEAYQEALAHYIAYLGFCDEDPDKLNIDAAKRHLELYRAVFA